ncbi:cupin domain-containing protein [Actinoplanes sp. NBRC 101535]|uniref:JmjC domain-containing protein n=1 Tax=Actinoplanes sp. NBRC 101535 TaxID=3032196 RepID=UPI0024A0EB7C|nr:cupin domain-containing protein [Actinoplanes sp. NBRC 101535]GLY08196.1 hypothetical protein Acsp01_85750 [Actinoplanes sp. NBRC 101535]
MDLDSVFGPQTAATLTATPWPDKPSTHRLPDDARFHDLIDAATLRGYLTTGCMPATRVNVINASSAVHPDAYTTRDGRLDPARLRRLRDAGCTIHMRHLEQWYPPATVLTHAIQQHLACPAYASAFTTPAGQQGLQWHWDQSLAVAVQLAGTKRWELWAPRVTDPLDEWQNTRHVWQPRWGAEYADAGPDQIIDLSPGDVLLLPRGWVHNPHSLGSPTESVHLTVMIQERTPWWIARRLAADTIGQDAFRVALSAGDLQPAALAGHVDATRRALIRYLEDLDATQIAGDLYRTALDDTPYGDV